MINKKYKYHVMYERAWYGKHAVIAAVNKELDTSYAQFPRFMTVIKTYNPGSVVKIEDDGD